MCSGLAIAAIAAAVLGTGATVRGQTMEGKARKGAREETDRKSRKLEEKRKTGLLTREQSLAKNIATSQQGTQSAAAKAKAAGQSGQTLGNQDLFKRTLG